MNCREVQEEVAVALLTGGRLDDATAAHVATCPDCAAEQASLRQVVEFMSAATLADITGADTAAPTSDVHLQRIVRAAAAERERGRRRWVVRALVAAAVAVVAVVGIGAVVTWMNRDDTITASAAQGQFAATADISSTDSGSELRVSITGVPRGTDCIMTVTTTDGQTEPVFEWVAEYDGIAHVVTESTVAPDDISHLTLTNGDGQVMLEIPVAT